MKKLRTRGKEFMYKLSCMTNNHLHILTKDDSFAKELLNYCERLPFGKFRAIMS